MFLAHPAGESFFVYSRTFATMMPHETAVIIETFDHELSSCDIADLNSE